MGLEKWEPNIFDTDKKITRAFLRREKAQMLGDSKIEKGINQFRVYRVAPRRSLFDLQEGKWEIPGDHIFNKIFRRAIFFTTQKEMALEYRSSTDRNKQKNILLKEKGIDFLDDLQKLESQGMKIVLLSHEDIIVFQKMRSGEIKSESEIENFVNNHMFDPSQVSPRMLRRAAEIIVLLPEGLNRLPLSKNSSELQQIKTYTEQKQSVPPNSPGLFHQTSVRAAMKKDALLSDIKKDLGKLYKERQSFFDKYNINSDQENEQKKRELNKINKQIQDLKKQREERLDKLGY